MSKQVSRATTEKPVKDGTKVTVSIKSGYDSQAAAEAVKKAGLVNDAEDFNTFLETNGYDMHISVGDFEISKGASYEEIANAITYK